MDISWWQGVLGLIQIFIIGWLAGALIAAIYNFGITDKEST